MNIKELIEDTKKPEIYTKGTASMWEDPHISNFLLEAHINPEHDLASRNGKAIKKTVNWILEAAGREKMEILDLGCGPGLYCELMAQRGHYVTGLDFSQTSISYAENAAKKKSLNIEYIKGNYLNLSFENRFDLIIMIYCDFGALIPSEREIVLRNIHNALKPGGIFIFDSVNSNVNQIGCKGKNWEALSEGFWSNKPYIVMSEGFHYSDNSVLMDQHIVIEDDGNYKIYRFWNHCFAAEEIEKEFKTEGFTDISATSGVLGKSNTSWNSEINFFKAHKA